MNNFDLLRWSPSDLITQFSPTHGERLHRPLGRPNLKDPLVRLDTGSSGKQQPWNSYCWCLSVSLIAESIPIICWAVPPPPFPTLQSHLSCFPSFIGMQSFLLPYWRCFLNFNSLISAEANSVHSNLFSSFIEHCSQLPSVSQCQKIESEQPFCAFGEWSMGEKAFFSSFCFHLEWLNFIVPVLLQNDKLWRSLAFVLFKSCNL